jgi:hypothetical protein
MDELSFLSINNDIEIYDNEIVVKSRQSYIYNSELLFYLISLLLDTSRYHNMIIRFAEDVHIQPNPIQLQYDSIDDARIMSMLLSVLGIRSLPDVSDDIVVSLSSSYDGELFFDINKK